MGVSQNGSLGLGGSAEGFEIVNQGVTRRFPGEGPKVNGGRMQSQEMDSYDQPEYLPEEEESSAELHLIDDPEWSEQEKTFGKTEGDEITVQINGRHPMDVLRTIAHELSHWRHGDTDGHDGSDDENRANAEAGEQMRIIGRDMPHMFSGGDEPFEIHGTVDAQGAQDFARAFEDENEEEIDEVQAQGWDSQIHQGLTNPGRDVSDEERIACVNEILSVLEGRGADKEYKEHGKTMRKLGVDSKTSKRIAKGIAADHEKEHPGYYRQEKQAKMTDIFKNGRKS